MPKIELQEKSFFEMLGFRPSQEEFAGLLEVAKAEIDDWQPEENSLKVELNDTNRPDLWSAEGIARQLRAAHGRRRDYPFFRSAPAGEIRVDAALQPIRPYVVAFVVRGLTVTETSLVQMIQTQEKLAENFGRKRKDVAIGVYNQQKITYPIHYHIHFTTTSTTWNPYQTSISISYMPTITTPVISILLLCINH